MSEITALTRLLIARCRTALIIAITYMLLIHVGAIAYSFSDAGVTIAGQRAVTSIVVMFSLPLLGITFALFDFSEQGDISGGATGYLPWLLRMPVRSWKLAAVPLGLKTCWTLAVCGAIALTARFFGMPLERWFIPAIGIATLFVLACLVTWQPFRWTYTRLSLIGILFVPAYAWLILSVSFAFADNHSHPPADATMVTAAWIVGLSTYTAPALLAARAVRLARCNVAGRISESQRWMSSASTASPTLAASHSITSSQKRRATISPIGALLRFEATKLAEFGTRIIVASWLLIVLFFSLFDQTATDTFVFLVVVFLFPALFLNEWKLSGLHDRFLQPTLAIAPIPTTTIVWTQQLITTAIWFASLLGVPVVMLIWHASGASVPMIDDWQRVIGSQFDAPDALGRLGIVAVIVAALLVVRQTTWNVAATSTDEKRFVYWMIAAKFAVAFAAFSWFLFQFLRFPDWEAWTQWMWQSIAELPAILPWLATAKAILVIAATALLYRSGLARPQTVTGLLVGYLACTFAIAAIVWHLLPGNRVTLWHCMAAIAVLMPYSRIVLAPLCLAYNRHA
ncbi:hypothetical protein Mal15_67100 [Stieleria maiorica]|uniref:Uncharacterized protein n=1 Tax=Stieleria maiorica TaxID=2795974 RepID=A0A5B9MMJ3_9BACT|nr:hypothetical protein [Stieleria maiorica]QEG02589.1 hypothetical protein Mal15_67100 [Stieleria maiorica]